MRALTLTQPWATLVAIGAKRVETRNWTTDYRGSLAIHAARTFPKAAKDSIWTEPFQSHLRAAGVIRFNIFAGIAGEGEAYLPLGAVVATAKLGDVWRIARPNTAEKWGLSKDEIAFGDYSIGRYAWFLYDIEPLAEPASAKGALGLWTWTDSRCHD